MPMQDLEEFLEPWLELPIRGKQYRVGAVDVETGLYAQHVVEVAAQLRLGANLDEADLRELKLDDDQERDFQRRLLPGVDDEGHLVPGGVYDEMITDGIPWEYLKHAARTAFIWTVQDRAAAEEHWAGGGRSPEASRPAPQDRLPAKKKTPRKKSGRPGSPATKKAAAKAASAGTRSSSTGA